MTYSVSATTRGKRPREEDGVAYHFLTRAEFERRVAANEFVEWAEYGGNLYGTLRAEIDRGIASGRHVVLDIEVQGAEQLRRTWPDAVQVFVIPPSGAELLARLKGRGTESDQAIRRRVAIASEELGAVERYDYVVLNDELEKAVERVGRIIDVEASRPARLPNLSETIAAMRRDLGSE